MAPRLRDSCVARDDFLERRIGELTVTDDLFPSNDGVPCSYRAITKPGRYRVTGSTREEESRERPYDQVSRRPGSQHTQLTLTTQALRATNRCHLKRISCLQSWQPWKQVAQECRETSLVVQRAMPS